MDGCTVKGTHTETILNKHLTTVYGYVILIYRQREKEGLKMKKGETVRLTNSDAEFVIIDFVDMGDGWYDAIMEKPHMPGVKWYGKVRFVSS